MYRMGPQNGEIIEESYFEYGAEVDPKARPPPSLLAKVAH